MKNLEGFPYWLLMAMPTVMAFTMFGWKFGLPFLGVALLALWLGSHITGLKQEQAWRRFEKQSEKSSEDAKPKPLADPQEPDLPPLQIRNVKGQVLHTVEAGTLKQAFLPKAFLREAKLGYENLQDADLREADLREADLTGAILCGADLSGADLTDAKLTGARLRGAKLQDCKMVRTNLDKADLRQISGPLECQHASLRNVDFTGTDLSRSCFRYCDLRGANLSRCQIILVDFSETNLQKAIFTDAFVNEILIEKTDLRNVDLDTALFVGWLFSKHWGARFNSTTRWPLPSLLPIEALGVGCAMWWMGIFGLVGFVSGYMLSGPIAAFIAACLAIPLALVCALLLRAAMNAS